MLIRVHQICAADQSPQSSINFNVFTLPFHAAYVIYIHLDMFRCCCHGVKSKVISFLALVSQVAFALFSYLCHVLRILTFYLFIRTFRFTHYFPTRSHGPILSYFASVLLNGCVLLPIHFLRSSHVHIPLRNAFPCWNAFLSYH